MLHVRDEIVFTSDDELVALGGLPSRHSPSGESSNSSSSSQSSTDSVVDIVTSSPACSPTLAAFTVTPTSAPSPVLPSMDSVKPHGLQTSNEVHSTSPLVVHRSEHGNGEFGNYMYFFNFF